MTDEGRQVVEAASRLREALEQTAGALSAADLEGLLRSEVGLELALKRVTLPRSLSPDERDAIRAELEGTRHALLKCRRLGDMLLDVIRLSFEAQGRTPAYGRHQGGVAVYGQQRVNTTG